MVFFFISGMNALIFCCTLLIHIATSVTTNKNNECNASKAKFLADCAMKNIQTESWKNIISCANAFIDACDQSSSIPTNDDNNREFVDNYDIVINEKQSFLRALGSTDGWSVKIDDSLLKLCNAEADDDDTNIMRNNKKKDTAAEYSSDFLCTDDDEDGGGDCGEDNTRYGVSGLSAAEEREYNTCVRELMDVSGCFVVWLGGFNVGKTTILNMVTGRRFSNGFAQTGETKGINFMLPDDDDALMDVIHVDTPGKSRSVLPSDLQDRYMTDKFLESLVPDLADRIVFIVDILTTEEQVIIDQLIKQMVLFASVLKEKKLYVVHNFRSLTAVQDVEEHIQSDIIDAFDAVGRPKRKPKGWVHTHSSGMKAWHLVLARIGSEAGDKYNERSITLLRHWLSATCTGDEFNVLDRFKSKLTPLLRDYFRSSIEKQDTAHAHSRFNPWEMLSRAKMVVGSAFHLKEESHPKILELLPERNQDPYALEFKNNDRIVLKIPRELEYCRHRSIGDIPMCRPEPDCNLFESPRVWLLQCILPNAQMTNSFEEISSKILIFHDSTNEEVILYGTLPDSYSHFFEFDDELEHNFYDRVTYGWISRSFQVPHVVNSKWSKHETRFEHGVLTIAVPKTDAPITDFLQSGSRFGSGSATPDPAAEPDPDPISADKEKESTAWW